MEKSHKSRFFLRNLTEKSTINQLPNIYRCKKCNHYNNYICNINHIQLCYFCGNPYSNEMK
jgi:rubrerythrin